MSGMFVCSGLVIESIEIDASSEEIAVFMSNPENEMKYNPGFKELLSVEGEGLGRILRFKAEVGGEIKEVTGVITEWEPFRKAASRDTISDGGHTSETLILTPLPKGTKLTVAMEYCFPAPTQGKYKQMFENIGEEGMWKLTRELTTSFMKQRLKNVKAAVEK